jgi:hypothetical protein
MPRASLAARVNDVAHDHPYPAIKKAVHGAMNAKREMYAYQCPAAARLRLRG